MNDVEVVDSVKSGLTVRKGEKSIELTPEVAEQVCSRMLDLGTQLISGIGNVTIESFKTEADMYYNQLNTYIDKQTINSNERMKILDIIERKTDKFMELIAQTDDVEKIEGIKGAFYPILDKLTNQYSEALDKNYKDELPQRPNMLSGLKNFFPRK